jgi:hypothetical protein
MSEESEKTHVDDRRQTTDDGQPTTPGGSDGGRPSLGVTL